ncbi:MAG: hypothetical protein V1658_01840 [Candidatus Micrarchaeota archaeon]
MASRFNKDAANQWLSRNPKIIKANEGKWLAIGSPNGTPKILSISSRLNTLIDQIGKDNLESVLLTKIPKNLSAVCIY